MSGSSGNYEGVQKITFNNPDKLNAMTVEMGECFQSVIKSISNDKTLKCLVINGKGKAFSAGGDLNFLHNRLEEKPFPNSTIMMEFYERFLCARRLIQVPIISAMNTAVGAGMCFALATDIRIANKSAKMGFNFTRLGIHPVNLF